MSDISDLNCLCCGEPLDRVRYFPRQLLTADDMRCEQEYFREKMRRHNRYLHGWGVVCGCTVEAVTDAKSPTVRVCPGYVVGPQGDEICIDRCIDVELKTGASGQPCSVRWPCPPVGDVPAVRNDEATVYIAVRYAECATRPVRVHPGGCGCDETGCEYSRVRDSCEIKVLWSLPASHLAAKKDDDEWCKSVRQIPQELARRQHTFPVPPCPECDSDPWVVLATVVLATGADPASGNTPPMTVRFTDRRVLLSTQRLQVAALCLP
jgi:hypothetical protein